ncbi:MAG: response regulator transcription factor [Anaerolineales bacterium]|nr:response regulator transcription factor [Anaerolineales bacterium]
MKVLIVEDNSDMREVLMKVLALPNIETEPAKDGETAVRKIESGYQPDLALLDLHLPGMGGEEVFRILREKTRSKIAVITVDDMAAPQFVEKADAVFTKPFSTTELLVKITSMALAGGESG